MKTKNLATMYAIISAALYAVSVPASKVLLGFIDPTMLAAFLYLGAGIGLFFYGAVSKVSGKATIEAPLTRKELPYTIGMIVLDIIAPILLMFGLKYSTSANASLINNFEIVATSLIALFVFKEVISKRLWIAIALVTVASIILTFEGAGSFDFNIGSLLVLGASLCWGFENNCTKMMSSKSSVEIVVLKGIFSGLGSLIVAFILSEQLPDIVWLLAASLLGFVSYGLSIHLYILAQKDLGAAKTSAYYSIAPFLGVLFGLLIGERPAVHFYVALAIMAISTWIMIKDSIQLQHTHEHSHIHCHKHKHGKVVHEHEHTHTHSHEHIHLAGEDIELHLHSHKSLPHNHVHST